jgi:hypothetical protein
MISEIKAAMDTESRGEPFFVEGPNYLWVHGAWQKRLAPLIEARKPVFDATIVDPPFGRRTHDGFRTTASLARKGIGEYSHWTPGHVHEFVRALSPLTRGWIVALTSHDLIPSWEDAFDNEGRLGFAPIPVLEERTPHAAPCAVLPVVIRGMGVRIQGDGPSNWTVWLVAARPRNKSFASWCKLNKPPEPYYLIGNNESAKNGRGKPQSLMRAIVRDYSLRGDIVADVTAGLGSTGCAALALGRKFVGVEVDSATWRSGAKALAIEASNAAAALPMPNGTQQSLWGDEHD